MDRREAEVATENWLKDQGYVTRRAVRTQWQKVDFFGADVMGKRKEGTVYIQTTTSQRPEQVRVRRRKLEVVPWNPLDRVLLFEVEERPNVVNRRKKDLFFRVHQYEGDILTASIRLERTRKEPIPFNPEVHVKRVREWKVLPEPIPILPEMLRVRKG